MASDNLADWVSQAQEIIQPILDGSELTDRYFQVEKEAMSGILRGVENLANHMKVLPLGCDCAHDEECLGYARGWDELNASMVAYLEDRRAVKD